MVQPQGFIDKSFPLNVVKLYKHLYGLKEPSRAWFEGSLIFFIGLGFQCSYADYSLFVRYEGEHITMMLLYMESLIIKGTRSSYINHLISQLSLVFEVKNLGKLHHCLGIKVNWGPTGLFLSQTKYAKSLLSRTFMIDYNPYGSPCTYKGNFSYDSTTG